MNFDFSIRRIIGLLGLVAIGFAIWLYFPRAPGEHSEVPPGRLLNAVYDGFTFSTAEERFRLFRTAINTSVETNSQKPHIRTRQGNVYELSIMKEDVIRELAVAEKWDSTLAGDVVCYYTGQTWIGFRNGKIAFATISSNTPEFYIGPSKDGPWVQLPVSRRRMIEVFGQPKRWTWSKNATGP